MACASDCKVATSAANNTALVRQVSFDDRRFLFFQIVQPSIIDIQYRVIAESRGYEKISRITRSGRHNYSQARDMRKPSVQGLTMLGALLATPIYNSSDHHCGRDLPAEHVSPFRRLVDD